MDITIPLGLHLNSLSYVIPVSNIELTPKDKKIGVSPKKCNSL